MNVISHQRILDYWFGEPESPGYGKPRKQWFVKNPDFDRDICDHFNKTYEKARSLDNLNQCLETPLDYLAIILLFDQFSRQMFRGTPQAFATDAKALGLAQSVVNKALEQQLLPVQRWFIYLPFEHSENLSHQYRAVQLFQSLIDDLDSASTIDYAKRHLAVIERFGRFPHRNAILGRKNTPEETDFLKQPGSSF